MKLSQLQEAKYHRSLSIDRVNVAYQDAYDEAFEQERKVSMHRPSLAGPQDNRYVYADILVYGVDDEQEATRTVKRFVEKYKIPYTGFHGTEHQTDTRDEPYWRVTVAYEENK